MKQCPKGHIYDEKRNSTCPYCSQEGGGFQPIGFGDPMEFPKTIPVAETDDPTFPATIPVDNTPAAVPAAASAAANPKAMSVTISLEETAGGINPVKGWLVAVDGEKKGLSFVIHGEQNVIGRGNKFDINLSFDQTVSTEGNAVIAYDSKNNKFFLSPVVGKGKNNVYYKDSILLMPVELHDYDSIQCGATTYVFRSFCNEEYTY